MEWSAGLHLAFHVQSLLAILIGSVIGLLLGVLPGLGGIFGLTLLIPLTFKMSTDTALGLLIALYTSAVYGGAITAILFRIPGHPGNIATSFEGPELTRRGRAGEAIVAVGLSGIIGGVMALAAVMFLGPVIANAGVKISPADYFMLAILGLSLVAASSGTQVLAGMALGGIGFMMSTVGQDPMSVTQRSTFGINYLGYYGINFSIVAIGIFAIGSALYMLLPDAVSTTNEIPKTLSGIKRGLGSFWREKDSALRGGLVGTVMGAIPGVGITLSNLVAYIVETKVHPKRSWGHGEIAGVMAPESADNATLVSELIPAFTLGIPGAPASALMLYAITVHGLEPGFSFFQGNPHGAAFFIMMFLSLIVFTIVGFSASGLLARAARIDPRVLAPCIVVAGCLGAYSVHDSYGDIALAIVFGVIGFVLLLCKLPLAPLLLGLILGPLAESNYRRAALISKATHSLLLVSIGPISLGIVSLAVLVLSFWSARRALSLDKGDLVDISRDALPDNVHALANIARHTEIDVTEHDLKNDGLPK